jgi:hypothetical protein
LSSLLKFFPLPTYCKGNKNIGQPKRLILISYYLCTQKNT